MAERSPRVVVGSSDRRGCGQSVQSQGKSTAVLALCCVLTMTIQMDRFFIYEEYGAKYEMMIKDVAMTHRSIPDWESHQRGLEVLASSLGSVNSQGYRSRKSLTIGDLLVKASHPSLTVHGASADSPTAHPENLQVSPLVCRASQAHSGRRRPQLAHGGGECPVATSRSHRRDQQSNKRYQDEGCSAEDLDLARSPRYAEPGEP